jgi:hypothetical protein
VAILPFLEQKEWAEQLGRQPSLDPAAVSPLALDRPAVMTCGSAYRGPSSNPPIPVGHYALAVHSSRDSWSIGDIVWQSQSPWAVGPEIPYDSWLNAAGPHDRGFNIATTDGSVFFRINEHAAGP